jgi:YbgC/YbaW family acyl-CoA thioester hydrolase
MSGSNSHPAEHPLTPRIRTEVQVMFFDTDCAAVVHNISYLRFIETARTLLAEQLGLGLAEMARSQLFPVVARTEIDYRRPAVLGDRLHVDGWLESLDRTRFWCGFAVRRASDDALMVSSRQMLALVQMPAGRPVRLPADWRGRYAHLFAPANADLAASQGVVPADSFS